MPKMVGDRKVGKRKLENRNSEICERYLSGESIGSLSRGFNISRQQVHNITKIARIHRDRVKHHKEIKMELAIRVLREKGKSFVEIASITGNSIGIISKHVRDNNIKSLAELLHDDGKAICTRCHRTLPVENFSVDRRKKRGIQSWCKECNKIYYFMSKQKRQREVDG